MLEMTYQDARAYLEQAAKKGIVLGLEVMEELLVRLGNPQEDLRIVHIAGTNGKGSVLAYIENIFLASGYTTGRYVSPAVGAYEERFLLNGAPIEKGKIAPLTAKVKEAAENLKEETGLVPTVFELETAMAFLCFQQEKVQIVLLETGMGGRLDATNVIQNPYLSIITSVSMDHMGVLGNTLREIAREKAGIIKKGRDTLLYPWNPPEVKEVIQSTCQERNSNYHEGQKETLHIWKETLEGSQFSYGTYRKLEIFLPGRHQIYNAVTAVAAVEILKKWFCISEFQVEEGLRRTRWKARLEKISETPLIYLDGAHNRDGAKRLAEFMEQHFSDRKILAVTGVLADKEYDCMMEQVLSLVKKTAVITPKNPRALPGSVLLETAKKYCQDVFDAGDAKTGLFWAMQEAKAEDVVLVFGSLSFMEEIREGYDEISKNLRA